MYFLLPLSLLFPLCPPKYFQPPAKKKEKDRKKRTWIDQQHKDGSSTKAARGLPRLDLFKAWTNFIMGKQIHRPDQMWPSSMAPGQVCNSTSETDVITGPENSTHIIDPSQREVKMSLYNLVCYLYFQCLTAITFFIIQTNFIVKGLQYRVTHSYDATLLLMFFIFSAPLKLLRPRSGATNGTQARSGPD